MNKTFLITAFLGALSIPASAQFYKQANLVSDISGMAQITDPNLINPWGMSSGPTPIWVSDQVTHLATIYLIDGSTGAVSKVPLEVAIPAGPTGQIFNGTGAFMVSQGGGSGPALFIFAGLNGNIYGWNPGVPPPVAPATLSKQAVLGAAGSPAPVVYTGLALANRGTDWFLYAANNAAGRIDVFNESFAKAVLPGTFTDPTLPAGNVPFNIVNIDHSLFVTYSGPSGIVNVFDKDGNFVKRFATGGTLINPWGIAMAPANFGEFSNALLIGSFNFGDPSKGAGTISAFASDGTFLGVVKDNHGQDLSIDGLWTLKFGDGAKAGITDVLYFSAGIQSQAHGLVGSLSACHGPAITAVSASPNSLWPPNHKMVPVTIAYNVTDDCTPPPSCALSVAGNEGEGGGSGHTSPDWQVLDAHHVDLRAERMGTGSGRDYTITIDCTDSLGLASNAATNVTVAHDRGKH